MFDLVTSGQTQVLGDQIGTGFVDFFDTLKPAANIFTDVSGNPITGITVVGPPPVIPPPPAHLTLAPATGTDPVGAKHTVTATVTDATAAPVPNTIVIFNAISGPNAGLLGGGITDVNGQAAFSYIGKGGTGTDSIQARIGTLESNIVQETWQQPTKCPQRQGFWKNNPNAWPVSSLVLGSQTYGKTKLLQILGAPGRGDASQILAVQLIAAKLNIALGSDPVPVSATIATADRLLSGFSGEVPLKVAPSSATGQSMTQSGANLGLYNSGQLTPSCTP